MIGDIPKFINDYKSEYINTYGDINWKSNYFYHSEYLSMIAFYKIYKPKLIISNIKLDNDPVIKDWDIDKKVVNKLSDIEKLIKDYNPKTVCVLIDFNNKWYMTKNIYKLLKLPPILYIMLYRIERSLIPHDKQKEFMQLKKITNYAFSTEFKWFIDDMKSLNSECSADNELWNMTLHRYPQGRGLGYLIRQVSFFN